MTKVEASQLVTILFASYPSAHIDRTHVDAYVSGITDLDTKSAAGAVDRLRRTSKFLPSIAEIRDACTTQSHGVARTGEEAYAELTAAVRAHGRDYGQGVPKFRDPLVEQCIGVWGSWNDACGSPVDDPGGRARFIELYKQLSLRTRQDLAAGKALPSPQGTFKAFWLEEPRMAAPAAAGPVANLAAVLERKAAPRAATTGTDIVPRKWAAEEIDAALAAGGSK